MENEETTNDFYYDTQTGTLSARGVVTVRRSVNRSPGAMISFAALQPQSLAGMLEGLDQSFLSQVQAQGPDDDVAEDGGDYDDTLDAMHLGLSIDTDVLSDAVGVISGMLNQRIVDALEDMIVDGSPAPEVGVPGPSIMSDRLETKRKIRL